MMVDTSVEPNLSLEQKISSYYARQEIVTFTPPGNNIMDICWDYSASEDAADLD
jgi:hypothetical protein